MTSSATIQSCTRSSPAFTQITEFRRTCTTERNGSSATDDVRALLRRNAVQSAIDRVLDHPYAAIRCDGHIPDLEPEAPPFGRRRTALTIEHYSGERPRHQAA